MKRITWWPQAWLGLTFNWGVPVGWAAADPALRADLPVMLLVYAACIAWTLGYDSIYATQDVEDDALAGVKSSARALGPRLKTGVQIFYALTLLLLGAAIWRWQGNALLLLGLVPAAAHLWLQLARFEPADVGSALRQFRANQLTGLLLVLPILLAALWPTA
jgi:4-hydroxybenzoate polyprenyltransferase